MTELVFPPNLSVSLEKLREIRSDQARIERIQRLISREEITHFNNSPIYVCRESNPKNVFYYWAENSNAHPGVMNHCGYLYYKFGWGEIDIATSKKSKFGVLERSIEIPLEVKINVSLDELYSMFCKSIHQHGD